MSALLPRRQLITRRPLTFVRRSLVFVHRWLGVGLSMLLTMWFVSGIVMMYWSSWTFSGLTSLQPFGLEKWLLERTVTEDMDNEESKRVFTALAGLLVDRPLPLAEYDVRPPAAVIRALGDFEVKSLDFGALDGKPVYLATDGRGGSRLVPMQGDPVEMLNVDDLARRIQAAVGGSVAVRVLDGFDSYYRDRKGRLPLPVISLTINDSVQTRYYVDPRTVSIIESYSSPGWVHRWLHHGLPFVRPAVALQLPSALGCRHGDAAAHRHGALRHLPGAGVPRPDAHGPPPGLAGSGHTCRRSRCHHSGRPRCAPSGLTPLTTSRALGAGHSAALCGTLHLLTAGPPSRARHA
jgi:hypothetical protein